MSKEAMRAEADRLIKEALEKKAITIKQGDTRIEATCGKCGGKNRVSAAPGQLRVPFTCKECGHRSEERRVGKECRSREARGTTRKEEDTDTRAESDRQKPQTDAAR